MGCPDGSEDQCNCMNFAARLLEVNGEDEPARKRERIGSAPGGVRRERRR
jgi:hypothetical protein